MENGGKKRRRAGRVQWAFGQWTRRFVACLMVGMAISCVRVATVFSSLAINLKGRRWVGVWFCAVLEFGPVFGQNSQGFPLRGKPVGKSEYLQKICSLQKQLAATCLEVPFAHTAAVPNLLKSWIHSSVSTELLPVRHAWRHP